VSATLFHRFAHRNVSISGLLAFKIMRSLCNYTLQSSFPGGLRVMENAGSKLYTIPAGVPFLDVLAQAILAGELPGPRGAPPSQLDLAGYTLYLPTRRACRAMREAFLSAASGDSQRARATLLPRIRPLGEVDEYALSLIDPDPEDRSWLGAGAPPAIPQLERILALSSIVLSWLQKLQRGRLWEASPCDLFASASPANAVELALELARLADQAQLEDRGLSDLASLASERFADHWRLTLGFLQIIAEQWPQYLDAAGLVDPMQRRNLLLQLEIRRIATEPEPLDDQASGGRRRAPIIIAGVTRSAPATLAFMKAVLATGRGAVVLPGLDLDLDEPSWRSIASSDPCASQHPEHPQYGLKRLLDRLGAARADVNNILEGDRPRTAASVRRKFLSEALRPAGSTHLWRNFIDRADRHSVRESLASVSLIAAPSSQDEAYAIALLLREAAETPGKTASLVTPERTLARRVAAFMRKWNIVIDDSAGSPLAHSRPGAFLDLVAEAASSTAPDALLSLLKHPLARLGLPRPELRRRTRIIEMLVMRQPWFEGGLADVRRSLAAIEEALAQGAIRHPTITRLSADERAAAADIIERLCRAFEPFMALNDSSSRARSGPPAPLSLASLAKAHRAAAEILARDENGAVAELWSGPAGGALDLLLQRLADAALPSPPTSFAAYAPVYRSLVRNEIVRPQRPTHPRLAIWGPLESRLLRPDMVILGGLNEGVWPETPVSGPWLNRSMRAELGLEVPEERVGLAAHDFAQLLCAQEVVLTRALKSGGAPTTPSRWIARISALLQGLGLDRGDAPLLASDRPWLAWAFARNTPIARRALRQPPAPCPPVSARPRKLPVTAIEAWLANPYAIFVRHILRLEPLAELARGLSVRDRGQVIHDALAEFCLRHPSALPADIAGELMSIGSALLSKFSNRAKVQAFWRPRLGRFSAWFAETEPARRHDVVKVLGELRGTLTIDGPAGPFTLTARADRIDLTAEGSLIIYDYKSSSAPTEQAVLSFRSPQLPLESLIAAQGGFQCADPDTRQEPVSVAKLAYITAGGGEPPGNEIVIKKQTPMELAKTAEEGVSALVARFDQPNTPYRALRRAAFNDSYRYDAYAHLSRAAEWLSSFETE
jgi:ATP-dependent helicase/nuclease subunit B